MNRNNSIDIAKGIGIFLVIWAHTICPISAQIYVFHMPLFFLVSGYLFNSRDSIKLTFAKKIKSLAIPFLFFLLFQRIGYILVFLLAGTFKTSYLLLWKPIPVRGVMGVLWFILALFVVTMTYSVIAKIPSRLLRSVVSLLFTLGGYLLYVYQIHLPIHLDSSMSMIFFFFFGHLLATFDLKKVGSVRNWMVLTLLSTALFLLCLKYYLPEINIVDNTISGNFVWSIGMMLLGCIMVLIQSKLIDYIPKVNVWLAYIGMNSLTIFAIHTVILEAVYLVYPKDTVSVPGGVIVSLVTLGICLLVNIGLQRYFPFVFGKKELFPRFMVWAGAKTK